MPPPHRLERSALELHVAAAGLEARARWLGGGAELARRLGVPLDARTQRLYDIFMQVGWSRSNNASRSEWSGRQ